MLNKALLIGNLGGDPKSHDTRNGGTITTFNLATTKKWKNKNTGEQESRTEWHRVVIYAEKLGDICMQYLRKGSKVFIEGEIRYSKYEKEGEDRWSTDIAIGMDGKVIFLDRKGQSESRNDANHSNDDYDDEIPPW